jgi:hypothetical protein
MELEPQKLQFHTLLIQGKLVLALLSPNVHKAPPKRSWECSESSESRGRFETTEKIQVMSS